MTLRKAVLCIAVSLGGPMAHADPAALLKLESTISLPEVKGRIDHFAIDIKRHRLFVAALGNDWRAHLTRALRGR